MGNLTYMLDAVDDSQDIFGEADEVRLFVIFKLSSGTLTLTSEIHDKPTTGCLHAIPGLKWSRHACCRDNALAAGTEDSTLRRGDRDEDAACSA